jgi:hypothetical protein
MGDVQLETVEIGQQIRLGSICLTLVGIEYDKIQLRVVHTPVPVLITDPQTQGDER